MGLENQEHPQATLLHRTSSFFFHIELIFNQHCLKNEQEEKLATQYSNAISNPKAQRLIKNQLIQRGIRQKQIKER